MADQPDGATEIEFPLLEAPREGVPPLIDTPRALEDAAKLLTASSKPTAFDTERAQGRRYGLGAYLVQIRKDDVGTFLIDSNELDDLSILQPAVETEWIFHAADQDLRCLIDLGLRAPSLFDTEIAARLLGYTRFSLGAITEQALGIRLQKAHQDEDWSRRPLPEAWLSYAALDVELLTELRSVMSAQLEELGRMEWAHEEFDFELKHPTQPRPPSWRNLKGIGKLRRPAELAIARALWTVREDLGFELDIAPGRLLNSRGILDASILQPTSRRAMMSIDTFKRPLARKHSDLWWSAIEESRKIPRDELPRRASTDPDSVPAASAWRHLDPDAAERLNQVRSFVAEVAEPLDLQSEVVLEPKVQRALAWKPLAAPGSGGKGEKPASFANAIANRLEEAGARAWQRTLFLEHLHGAKRSDEESLLALRTAMK